MLYQLLRALARLLLTIFYRRIEVVGLEHLPARGPVIVVANHHNGAIDSALLLSMIPRPLAIIAQAPLFPPSIGRVPTPTARRDSGAPAGGCRHRR